MNKSAAKDLAYNVLLLERQLEAYQELHEEEWAAIRKALAELKARVLAMAPAEDTAPNGQDSESPSSDEGDESLQ
jgi:hypothetical protein